jgi:hypothetical protein
VSAGTAELFESFQKVLAGVRNAVDDDVYWSWDGRLQAAFVVVQTGQSRALNDILGSCFNHRWDIESILEAPGYVRDAVDVLVGLREHQFIYTTEPDETGLALYAAYWPWTNGDLISIRVSLLSKEPGRLSPEVQTVLLNRTLGANH